MSIFTKVVEIHPILDNIRQHLTVFPSDFNNIYQKYFGILQNLTRNYEILQKFMKATIFHSIFSVKSLNFVPFRPITKYYWHFMISYGDKQNTSNCYCTILPLGDISKYFAIVKRKVIFSISQILTPTNINFFKFKLFFPLLLFLPLTLLNQMSTLTENFFLVLECRL